MIWAIDQDNQNHDALSGLLGDFTSSQLQGGGENKPLAPFYQAQNLKSSIPSDDLPHVLLFITLRCDTDLAVTNPLRTSSDQSSLDGCLSRV